VSDYWTDSAIEKPQQIIVCAAIRFGSLVLCGARHWDSAMISQVEEIGFRVVRDLGDEEQGFINQFSEFLTREEAMQVVKESGQPFNIERNRGDSCLFSEGLY